MESPEEIWRKMVEGEEYQALHPHLIERLGKTREKIWEYNNLHPSCGAEREAMLRGLLGSVGERIQINQPFRCDFGSNISVGDDFFANFNLTILDEAKVTFGDHVFIGPNVSIYTACHPLESDRRNTCIEWAEPVTVGSNVWIGGSVTILPGVTIGDNCVIGAGSVVSRSIPSGSVAVGNPARVIKRVE